MLWLPLGLVRFLLKNKLESEEVMELQLGEVMELALRQIRFSEFKV